MTIFKGNLQAQCDGNNQKKS